MLRILFGSEGLRCAVSWGSFGRGDTGFLLVVVSTGDGILWRWAAMWCSSLFILVGGREGGNMYHTYARSA